MVSQMVFLKKCRRGLVDDYISGVEDNGVFLLQRGVGDLGKGPFFSEMNALVIELRQRAPVNGSGWC